jgi:hypothetical protein
MAHFLITANQTIGVMTEPNLQPLDHDIGEAVRRLAFPFYPCERQS